MQVRSGQLLRPDTGLRQRASRACSATLNVGKRDPARGPYEEPDAEFAFEKLNLPPERRREHFHPLRRPAEVKGVGGCQEAAQLMEVDKPASVDYID